jgi:AcrR family transcriptional regulator
MPRFGLRERKKARTRAAIRRHALRLFREQGYSATTVDQIAEAAEVSPSTFFRYFPTKEDVVLQDDVDLLAFEAFEGQPPGLGPIAAMRAAIASAFGQLAESEREQLRETAALTLAVPELRARALDEFIGAIQALAEAIAKRTGHDPGEFRVRNFAGALVGVMMSASLAIAEDPAADFAGIADAALAHLEAGLPL